MAISDKPAVSAAGTPVQTPTSTTIRSGQCQRQSCDRCHKKKLRCTRDKNSNGGVCDRCLSKHTQCVYSLGLPKGRPSLHRALIDEPASTLPVTTTAVEPGVISDMTRQSPKSGATTTTFELGHEAAYPQSVPAHLPRAPTSTPVTEVIAPAVAPFDMNLWTLPWPEPTSTEVLNPEMNWTGMDFSQVNVENMLAATNGFESNGNVHDMPDMFSPRHSPSSQDSAYVSQYSSSQLELAGHEMQSIDSHMGDTIPSTINDNNTGLVTAQLSEMVVHLSSLRSSAQNLAQATDPSICQMLNSQHLPLIDSAAFESVAAWLTHGSFVPPPQSRTQKPTILCDVFSASHRFIEIIQHLPFDQIVRHLVFACEALFLEIYLAILTALEHEAYRSNSPNAAPLCNVRLVLVVQLCAYLIEHQHQAVDKCVSPANAQKHQHMPNAMPFQLDTVNGDYLKTAQRQVQEKLTQLRRILRCT